MCCQEGFNNSASPAVPGTVPSWVHFTVTYLNLAAAALSNDIQLFSLAALDVIHAFKVRETVKFAGPGMGVYNVSIGVAADLQQYTALYDVFTFAPGAVADQLTPLLAIESDTLATSIRIYGESDINLNLATAGTVVVSVLRSRTF